MSRSVINQTEARGIKRFLGTGLQSLEEGVPSNYTEDPRFCPYFLDETCEGAKDSDYKGRCESETFAYLNCGLYAYCEDRKNKTPKKFKVSNSLSDTVIMSPEDIVNSRPKKRNHHSRIDDSIHDRIAEGESDRKFDYLRRTFKSEEVIEIKDESYIDIL